METQEPHKNGILEMRFEETKPSWETHEIIYEGGTNNGEVDPNGLGVHDMGAKMDSNKPDCSLLLMFGKALQAVAEVGTFGATKYTRGGWQRVEDGFNRYTAALLRHLFKENYKLYDDNLPVLHASQVAWNALARLELLLRIREEEKE